MSQLPTPPIHPFERLNATDGLLINAERWRKVQQYHRQRQNFHYQALHQPGIVYGLGVKLITPNSQVPEIYKDGRGIQVQPGIAIDLKGNPIIVPQPQNLHIDKRPQQDSFTVYVIVDYRDPDDLEVATTQEMLQEKFRLDVKVRPPNDLEIELCRIIFPANRDIQVTLAEDILRPGYNNIDFRHRQLAGIRPQETIKIAQLRHSDRAYGENFVNLDYLLTATTGLYPQLQGSQSVELVGVSDPKLQEYDLLYLTGQNSSIEDPREIETLQQYLASGGVLLIDGLIGANNFNQSALALTKKLGYSLQPLSKTHYLRRQPFLFAALPQSLNNQPLQIVGDRGVIMVYGNLGSLWGLDEQLSFSREQIRSGQELGINILHYAWKHRYFIQLQQ
ncbi:MAG: DUF4159 domain-containing protein [Xenococcaceae cyanobacterium MO_188.B29]|nr:DUF4159 domain-containing protein [Xenococcaceae cyanobacterium MO_188.B29]